MLDLGVRARVAGGAMMKLREVIWVQGATAAAVLLLLVNGVAGCSPVRTQPPAPLGAPAAAIGQATPVSASCPMEGWAAAAQANAGSLRTLTWAPFGRAEAGWETYAPLIQQVIGTSCAPDSEGFAAALAAWQKRRGVTSDGVMNEAIFLIVKDEAQGRREFLRFTAFGGCPETPDLIAAAKLAEGYGGKQVWLRPRALDAYRRLVAAARAEAPEIAADPRNLTIFSGYRSPAVDAARCEADGNCDGVTRARCSAHRTGLAVDLYVGQAPGYPPDSSADPNRLYMTRTATYRWLVANAERFGFVNYPFEPWHWEWTGEPP